MSTTRYAFQSPSVSDEKGAYRMRPPRSSRPEASNLRHSQKPPSQTKPYLPYRRTRRLVTIVALLACGAFFCFACAYWLLTTRCGRLVPLCRAMLKLVVDACQLATSGGPEASPTIQDKLNVHMNISHSRDAFRNALDEDDARLDALRADPIATFLAYLPHSGLHNQRIALENALVLARLLNRTLLVPPARLGAIPLRYVRSSTLVRALSLDDKKGLLHCADVPADVPLPDECADYFTHTLVPWSSLVDLAPFTTRQPLIRVSNLSAAWMEETLGVHPGDTFALPDTDPYEFHFVDTPDGPRTGDKYHHAVLIETLAASSKRLIQLGTLFGSSRLRLRHEENRRIRGEIRRNMLFSNGELTRAADGIRVALGRVYLGAHIRVGDGRFQRGAQANVRLVWWKLVHEVLGIDTQMALSLEKRVLAETFAARTAGHRNDDDFSNEGDNDDDDDDATQDEIGALTPPKIPVDLPSRRVPHPPLPPLPRTFSPKVPCRARLHTTRSLLRLNIPLFIATDAQDPLTDPLLAPMLATFPCTFFLSSFVAETAHLEELTNGYDGIRLAGFVAPIVDALVLGRAWAVVGTEGSTFSRYVSDVLWRAYRGWEIVQRG